MTAPIRLQNVTKRYGDQLVISNLSLTLAAGQAHCLTGPSGCGKTTLLRLVLGLTAPDAGEVWAQGRLSAVFQEDRLLPRQSAWNNLRFIAGAGREEEGLRLLRDLGLDGTAARMSVEQLSGGMARRVAIARALLAPFDWLLLDEPFNGLDDAAMARVAGVVLERAGDRSILLVSHDARGAQLLGAGMVCPFASSRQRQGKPRGSAIDTAPKDG